MNLHLGTHSCECLLVQTTTKDSNRSMAADDHTLQGLDLTRVIRGEPPATPDERSCFNCAHLARESESWEMPHIRWYECNARPANQHLKAFPFKHTTCKLHKAPP